MIVPARPRLYLELRRHRLQALAVAAACALSMAPASLAAQAPTPTLVRATDTLGRDISGMRQSIKPLQATSRPLLVQVLDEGGRPVPGVQVSFRVEPSLDEEGLEHVNGGLVQLAAAVTTREQGGEMAPARADAEPKGSLTLTTGPMGYAGAYYYAGRTVETVGVTAFLTEAPGKQVRWAVRILNPRWGFLLWSGLLGGLALFLLGMRTASQGLEQAAGGRLRHLLSRVSENRLLGLTIGIVVTALIQSSGATTVMVVSFTNAGLMTLGQTLAIILGADIGTTLTVQIIAFSLKDYSLLVVALGFAVSILPARRYRGAGTSLLGFGLIFYGMALMGTSMEPLRDQPLFRQLLVAGQERPLLVLVGAAVLTGLIHSSAATIGIALTFAFQGLLDLHTAIPVILGANIGTSVTAFLVSLGARREAQRVAYAHILFKVLAVLLTWPLLGPFTDLVRGTAGDLPRQIANAHTIFNVAAAFVFLPFLSQAERALRRLVPDSKADETRTWRPKYLDDRILETPVLALAQVTREISRMGDSVLFMLKEGERALRDRDQKLVQKVIALDDKVDVLDTALRRYLTRLSRGELTEAQAAKVASLLYLVHHLESIGDIISKNLMEMGRRVIERDLRFSEAGYRQWLEFWERNVLLLDKALAAFATNDREMAAEVVRAKEEMSRLARSLHFRHLGRLGQGIPETQETSEIHIHLVADLRRVLSNTVSIAAAVVNEYRLPDLPTPLRESQVAAEARPDPPAGEDI